MNFYNENDPFCVEWLNNMKAAGHIPEGTVDGRSITDVQAADLVGYRQCHFFTGIAGWSEALRIAGWSEGKEAWTGSCPCQSYSVAGKGKGDADERNLWPHMFRLIASRKPQWIFGEQVANAIGHGWIDGVCRDLEGQGYTTGFAVLGAHSIRAPHVRQRLYWGAVRLGDGIRQRLEGHAGNGRDRNESGRVESHTAGPVAASGAWADSRIIDCIDGKKRRISATDEPLAYGLPRDLGFLQSDVRQLATGARRNRKGRLKAYGNSIVPQVAAVFIQAFMEAVSESEKSFDPVSE